MHCFKLSFGFCSALNRLFYSVSDGYYFGTLYGFFLLLTGGTIFYSITLVAPAGRNLLFLEFYVLVTSSTLSLLPPSFSYTAFAYAAVSSSLAFNIYSPGSLNLAFSLVKSNTPPAYYFYLSLKPNPISYNYTFFYLLVTYLFTPYISS